MYASVDNVYSGWQSTMLSHKESNEIIFIDNRGICMFPF